MFISASKQKAICGCTLHSRGVLEQKVFPRGTKANESYSHAPLHLPYLRFLGVALSARPFSGRPPREVRLSLHPDYPRACVKSVP